MNWLKVPEPAPVLELIPNTLNMRSSWFLILTRPTDWELGEEEASHRVGDGPEDAFAF